MSRNDREPEDFIPLNPARYHILSSLFAAPKHGYAIIKDIEEVTDARIALGVPTVYENIKRLLEERLIEPAGEQTVESGERRKTYRLAGLGRAVLAADEATRRPVSRRNQRGRPKEAF